jgi:serine/threonine protein kinase
MALLPNGVSISVLGIALACLLYLGRRRDFVQRATIEKQRGELTALNQQLEDRVASQVSEITRRADEVEQLNAQLQAQVRERSQELALALERLSARREEDGRLPRGTVLAERFVVDGLIGEGGMGSVYSGNDQSTGARVAIKVIQASSAKQLDALHRFLREARLAATVSHPSIVRMLHVDVSDDGMLFQVQELVSGDCLDICLQEGRRWDPLAAARLLAELCEALSAAHAQGIVHRDVKPANVMLTHADPALKLLDFGISKLREDASASHAQTRTGMFIGTPAYMAPEQLDGRREVTDRADVYAVGVLAFLLLSGRHPFEHLSLAGAIVERQSGVPLQLDAAEPSVPEELCILVSECLRRDPDDRPSTSELAQRLAAFANAHGAPSLVELDRMGRLVGLTTPPAMQATVHSMPTRARR